MSISDLPVVLEFYVIHAANLIYPFKLRMLFTAFNTTILNLTIL